ncbi:MAG: DUF3667 domain-containing protein [Bacteroidota bacterium]
MTSEDYSSSNNRFCRNCYYPLSQHAKYCPSCGQKHTDGRITLRQLLEEAWDALFDIDSKIFRTLGALFIPGRLTKKYFAGQHRRYVHPVRIFIVFAIGLIASVNFVLGDKALEINDSFDEVRKGYQFTESIALLDSAIQATESIYPRGLSDVAKDTLRTLYIESGPEREDSIMLNDILQVGGEEGMNIADEDYLLLSADSIMTKYQVEGFWNQMMLRQKLKFFKQGDNFITFILGKVSWGMLLMMPFLALIYRLIYVRRSFYYIEHLIFCLHTHTFVFLLFSLVLLLNEQLSPQFKAISLSLSVPVYILIAMKAVYQQSWIKTFLKFLLISMLYMFLVTIFAVLVFLASFFLF